MDGSRLRSPGNMVYGCVDFGVWMSYDNIFEWLDLESGVELLRRLHYFSL